VATALELQEEMLKTIKMTMPYPHSAFLGGATLGLREALTYSRIPFGESNKLIAKVFKASGTSHVLAVSGLHVGFIAGAFLALFSGLRVPRKIYAPLIIVSLVIFTILTGARPATIRASIMMGLIVLGLAYLDQGLKNSVLFGLCLAALFILVYNPKLIYEASFTLSFAAVLCLALLTGPVERFLDQIRDLSFLMFWICLAVTVGFWSIAWNFFFRWYVYVPYCTLWGLIFYLTYRYDRENYLLGGFGFHRMPTVITGFIAAQFAIQLGMMWPLSSYYFQAFPVAGAFANLIAIPLVGVVVPLGLLAGLLGLIPDFGIWLALVVNAGNYLAVTAFLWITDFFASYLPFPLVRKMTLFHMAVLYGALVLLAFWETIYHSFKETLYWLMSRLFGRVVIHPKKIWFGSLVVGGLVLFGMSFQYEPTSEALQVTVLNVGYGNGVAVRTPDEKRFLLNGGARKWDWHNPNNLPDRRDDGKQVIASYFLDNRIKTLDGIVAQAPEPQYIGGVPVVLKHFSVDHLYGSLPEDTLTPFNKDNYLKALDNYYYEQNADKSWFERDYYGNWKRLWNQVQSNRIPYSRPTKGTKLYEGTFEGASGKRITLSVLHPPEETYYERYASSNRSLVLSLRVQGGPSFLFPGDLRKDGQQELVESLGDRELDHDVLLVPSSGMEKSSVREEFVNSVDPQYLVFSTGAPEIKGPLARDMKKQFSKNIKKAQSLMPEEQILRTDVDYAVTFRTEGEQLEVRTLADEE
jgi:ComEC/Rec2-related protein